MRRITLLGLLFMTQFLPSSMAFASHTNLFSNQNGYFGLAGIKLSEDDFAVSGGSLVSGLALTKYIAVESLLGIVSEDSTTIANTTFVSDIEYFSSVRLRFNYEVKKMIPYLYLGYSGIHVKNTITDNITNVSSSSDGGETGFSYGLGIDLFGSRTTAIFLSTGVFLKNSDVNLKTSIIGFRYYLSRQRPSGLRH